MNKKAALQAFIKNAFVRHRKQWLPYGAILFMLAGIWWLWDGVSVERQDLIREKKDVSPSSPVFSAPKDGTPDHRRQEGRLVVPSAQAIRRHALPDLFAPEKQEVSGRVVQEISDAYKTEENTFPRLCGIIYHNGAAMALLEWNGQAGACMAGDHFGGCTVVFVGEEWAVLEKNGRRVTVTMEWSRERRRDNMSEQTTEKTQKDASRQEGRKGG